MDDCVFSPVCDGPCRCFSYLSANTNEGYELSEEYWNRVREANKPVRLWLESVKANRLQEECDE